jgi:hypothetical protein
MRFTLDQPILAAALQRAVAFADTRSPIPILACVKLEVSESSLSLCSTNMTFGMTASVPLVGAEPGSVATEAARLANLVASLRPGEPVELHRDPALTGMGVRSGRTKARLAFRSGAARSSRRLAGTQTWSRRAGSGAGLSCRKWGRRVGGIGGRAYGPMASPSPRDGHIGGLSRPS